MRMIRLLIVFIAGILSSLLVNLEPAFAYSVQSRDGVINDSLVRNLRCENLNVDSIYNAIREDAFDQKLNMPLKNWKFKRGLVTIAGCWGLASTQRLMFYLARYNTTSFVPMNERVATVLDMIRGEALEERPLNYDDTTSEPYVAKPLKKYSVFGVEESSLIESRRLSPDSLWNHLHRGYDQSFNGVQKQRWIFGDIEANQANRFFRASNLKMVVESGERSAESNLKTWSRLKKNLDGKRLTLLNLRVERTNQHIVLAKSYQRLSNDLFAIKVYDSNSPHQDLYVFFDLRSNTFSSPRIHWYLTTEYSEKPLGAYIVDEEERPLIDKALLDYYRGLCQ